MGDHKRRETQGLKGLRDRIAEGPPPRPSEAHPGKLLTKYKDCINEIGEPPTAKDAVAILAHIMDLERWELEMDIYREQKAMLDKIERRVMPVGAPMAPPGRGGLVPR